MKDLKAYVLCPVADEHPLYESWLPQSPVPVEIVRDYNTDWMPPDDAGLVITHVHYRWEEISILRKIKSESKVPILILADGILEYRNTFEHPDLPDGAMFQPLMGHKIACIGRSQARLLESWGNLGKCEVVGLPRLDAMRDRDTKELPPSEEFSLLVTTARTPYFTDKQRQQTLDGLQDLKDWCSQTPAVANRKLRVHWRLAGDLHEVLDVPRLGQRKQPMEELFHQVCAVVTTPSTLQLEASYLGRPVAIIDYSTAPAFVPAAWAIRCKGHIASVVEELATPPAARMLYQASVLHDSLECQAPATPRMCQLIWHMVSSAQRARESGAALELAQHILRSDGSEFALPQPGAQLSELFADNPVFHNLDVAELQAELVQAQARMGNYPDEYFRQKKLNRDLHQFVNWVRVKMRNREADVQRLREQICRLKSELQNLAERK